MLLNRSYDTARAGRRIRSSVASARSSARGSRVRPVVSTSFEPVTGTAPVDDADRTAAAQDAGGGGGQTNDAGTSDSLGRRPRRRRRTENETEKETSLPAEDQPPTLDDDRPANGSFATPANSDLLDVGSPTTTDETVKTKKRTRKKPRGSSEALSSNANEPSAVDQNFEPDLSISKDFMPSFEMRTSSPVELLSIEPQRVPDITEIKVPETERDPHLWSMFDTPLNDLCKRLLADQTFDKFHADEKLSSEVQKLKHLPAADDLRETEAMEVDVNYQMQPETTMELPLKVKKRQTQADAATLPLEPSFTALPISNERPVRRKPARHKKQAEDVPAEQPIETYEDSRLGVDSSQFRPYTRENKNVPNVLAAKSKLSKNKKQIADESEEQPAETYDEDSKTGEDSSQFSTEPDSTENRNVPNVLSVRETEAGKPKLDKNKRYNEDVPAAHITETRDDSSPSEDSSHFSTEPYTAENRNVPNVLSLRETEAGKSKRDKNKKHPEHVSAEPYESDGRLGEHSGPVENSSSQSSPEPGRIGNRNVPNVSSRQECKHVVGSPSPGFSEPALRETSEPMQAEVGEVPDVILPSPTAETVTRAPEIKSADDDDADDDDDDFTAAEELERLEREQRQLMEEEKLRQEQRERLEKEEREQEIQVQQDREREKTERRERKRQDKEAKEQRRRERKERKELENRQRETVADELPANQSNEPKQVQTDRNTSDQMGSPAVSIQDSGYTEETVEIKIEELRERTTPNVNDEIDVKTASYDPYVNIPMVDDDVDEENIPPTDYSRRKLTPIAEKSPTKKPPSGRKMPPRSPLFPAPVPAKPEDEQKDTLTYFRATTPRTTLKEAKARDRESSVRQRSRSADRYLPPDRSRTGPHLTVVDIDIESEPADSIPASLSASFDAGQPYSASSPIPPDFLTRRSLRPARSEEMLFVKKLSSRSPTPSYESNDSSLGDGGQWIRAAKSTDCLNRSLAGSEFSGGGLGRRAVSREWQVVTTTTQEEIVFVKPPGEDTEERKRIKAEYEKNKQVREMNEQRLTKEREKLERERLDRLLAELKRRRQKERQQLLEKKLAEKRAKEENDRYIREAVEQQRQKRLAEDKARREEEQRKRDELNEKWRKEREQREQLAKENQEILDRERQQKELEIEQLRSHMEENERQEREEQERRKKESQERREKEERERREREQKEKLEQERQRREKLAHEEKMKVEQREREAKLLREKMEKERTEKEARRRREDITENKNVPNVSAAEYKLSKNKKQFEGESEQPTETVGKDSSLSEDSSQFSIEPDTSENRNVPNVLSLRETETGKPKLGEDSGFSSQSSRKPVTTGNRNVPNIFSQQETKTYYSEPVKHEKQDQATETGNDGEHGMMGKLAEEHRLKMEELEEERRLDQKQLEREETEKQLKEDNRKLEQERREKDALEKIIQEQKLRLEELERQEKLRAEQVEKEGVEQEEKKREKRTSTEKDHPMTGGDISPRKKDTDSVFVDQPSTSRLSPSSPGRPRLPSREMSTQTDERSAPSTVVGQVRHYPAEVVTERLVSDSESPTSTPLPNVGDRAARAIRRPADPSLRRRAKSLASVDDVATSVIVHEYGELLSFWRGDPTDGRLTRARASSLRAAGTDIAGHASVRDFDHPPEQWSSNRLDAVEQPPNDSEDNQSKSDTRPTTNTEPAEPMRHHDDDDCGRPASATEDHDISEKSLMHSTLGCIGQYLYYHLISRHLFLHSLSLRPLLLCHCRLNITDRVLFFPKYSITSL